MFIYWTKFYILSTLFLTVVAQDIAPNVYCNKQSLTWDKAREACLNATGTFIGYTTGLGLNVDNLSLTNETDIWTADYAWETSGKFFNYRERSEKLCGFCKMDHGKCSLEATYSDCDTPRHFVCSNSSTKRLDVFYGRRECVKCPDPSVSESESKDLLPGFYWTTSIVNMTIGEWSSSDSGHHPVMCGAYKKSIGKYFGECKTNRLSLCNINTATGNYRNSFDKNCFDNRSIRSTPKTTSISTQSTVLNTTTQSKVTQIKTSLKLVTIPVETIETTTNGVIPHVTVSTHHGTVASSEDGRSENQSENGSNVGVTVGLPVGLGIIVTCGIVLSIYIIRRYKQAPDNKSPGLKVFWNSTYSTQEESSRFNKNSKRSADHSVDKENDNSDKIPGDSLRNKDSDYAVVRKNNLHHMKQDRKERSLSTKYGDLNSPGFNENRSNYYAKVGNNENANRFAETDAMHTSAYSFAREIAGDKVDNKGKNDSVIEDEYDVTNNIPDHRSPDNIYNTLQSEDYGRVSALKTDDTTYNVLSAPRSMGADSIYDSTNQNNHSGSTDNTYNHMTEPETYGSSSISTGRKLHHRNDTDQTYDKLN